MTRVDKSSSCFSLTCCMLHLSGLIFVLASNCNCSTSHGSDGTDRPGAQAPPQPLNLLHTTLHLLSHLYCGLSWRSASVHFGMFDKSTLKNNFDLFLWRNTRVPKRARSAQIFSHNFSLGGHILTTPRYFPQSTSSETSCGVNPFTVSHIICDPFLRATRSIWNGVARHVIPRVFRFFLKRVLLLTDVHICSRDSFCRGDVHDMYTNRLKQPFLRVKKFHRCAEKRAAARRLFPPES